MIHQAWPADIQSRGKRYELFFYASSGNWSTPFRPALAEIVARLRGIAPVVLKLPTYEPGEDCVEGTLTFGDAKLAVYFEFGLGYLALETDRRETLVMIAEGIEAKLTANPVEDSAP